MVGNLKAIVALHQTLTKLAAAEARLAGIPDWMRELHEKHSVQKAEIDETEAERDRTAQERRAAEAGASDAQQQLQHYQEQISRVSTQREYGALLKEIDTARGQVATCEREALEALERQDELETKMEELRASFADLDHEYHQQLAKWEAEKPEVERTAAALRREVEELRKEIPRPTQGFFDRLYERTAGQPLAAVRRTENPRGGNATWFCSSCSFRVRPQLVVQIADLGTVTQCDSCKRILFLEEEAVA